MPSPKIEAIQATLSAEERREIVIALLPGFVKKFRKPRAVYDESGEYLGEYVPAQPVPPPQPLSEETRKWLSQQVCKSRQEWKQEMLATRCLK